MGAKQNDSLRGSGELRLNSLVGYSDTPPNDIFLEPTIFDPTM